MTAGQPDPGEPLQFDRVEPAVAEPGATASPAGVTCRVCGATITTEYFAVGGTPICAACKLSLEQSEAAAGRWPRLVRAAAFGLAAAIAGAILYYAVIAITGLEIGLVAIVIGYMVGWAVMRGTGGRGGRRYQLLAVFLTYASVGLAYMPVALKQAPDRSTTASVPPRNASPDVAAPAAAARHTPPSNPQGTGGFWKATGMLLLFSLALPVLVVAASLPSGLISALIIGIGMQQAWRMTAAPHLEVTGPYRVNSEPAAPPG